MICKAQGRPGADITGGMCYTGDCICYSLIRMIEEHIKSICKL